MSKTSRSSSVLLAGLFLIASVGGVYLLSMLVTYFNTGAERSDIYHADAIYFDKAKPHVSWVKDDPNIEGEINPYIRMDIQEAYTQAIRALNLSQSLDKNVALREHFTVDLRDKIIRNLDTLNKIAYTRVNLTHTLRLHFLSLDKSVVSFTDINSLVKKNIYGHYIDSTEAYNVNMTLVDGRWRIDALENTTAVPDKVVTRSAVVTQELFTESGINYYPSATPWKKFWTEYNQDTINRDLHLIKKLGFRNVRFFIPFETFGGGVIDLSMIKKLDHLIETATSYKLNLIPTLFDFPIGYELDKYPMYDRQLEFLLKRYNSEDAIALWDLKNEPNLDFEHLGKKETMEWLSFIISRARVYTDKPITLGWSDYVFADLFCDRLDVISFHFYKDISLLEKANNTVINNCNKPILISEYGMSTYSGIWPGGYSEHEQNLYHQELISHLKSDKIGGLAWCLYDYDTAPAEVFGWKPWAKAKQKNFGLINFDGSRKMALDNYLMQ